MIVAVRSYWKDWNFWTILEVRFKSLLSILLSYALQVVEKELHTDPQGNTYSTSTATGKFPLLVLAVILTIVGSCTSSPIDPHSLTLKCDSGSWPPLGILSAPNPHRSLYGIVLLKTTFSTTIKHQHCYYSTPTGKNSKERPWKLFLFVSDENNWLACFDIVCHRHR